jgi:preprotein translocase subunit SecG
VNFLFYTSVVLFILICVFLVLLVLIQKGRGGGLASAFGGGGGNTAFGSKTGDVLTWATSIVFGIFILLAVALNLLANHRHNSRVAGITNSSAATAGGEGQATPEPTAGDTTAAEDVKTQSQIPPATGLPPAISGENAVPPEQAPPISPAAVERAPGATPPPATKP